MMEQSSTGQSGLVPPEFVVLRQRLTGPIDVLGIGDTPEALESDLNNNALSLREAGEIHTTSPQAVYARIDDATIRPRTGGGYIIEVPGFWSE